MYRFGASVGEGLPLYLAQSGRFEQRATSTASIGGFSMPHVCGGCGGIRRGRAEKAVIAALAITATLPTTPSAMTPACDCLASSPELVLPLPL